MGRHKRSHEPREYFLVLSDALNTAGQRGKYWIEYSVPTKWLLTHLNLMFIEDVSTMLANYTLDKDAILRAAIADGVAQIGW